MSGNDAAKPATQFAQSTPRPSEAVRLNEQYKSIGISAVSAAAQFVSPKNKKPPNQMS